MQHVVNTNLGPGGENEKQLPLGMIIYSLLSIFMRFPGFYILLLEEMLTNVVTGTRSEHTSTI